VFQVLMPPFQIFMACLVFLQPFRHLNVAVFSEEGVYTSPEDVFCDRDDFSCALVESLTSDVISMARVHVFF
jgi:hypothetical protein